MQLFVNNLTVIDCTYLHPDYGLEGESWIVDVILHGVTDDQGMIMDFGPMKKAIKQSIDTTVDHALLVPMHSARLQWRSANELTYRFAQNDWLEHRSPAQALCVIETEEITSSSVSAYLEQALRSCVPATVERVEVILRTEDITDDDYYHYSHGLKKHDGNCQRIAHGHRSRLRIWKNQERATDAEQVWASRFAHIYIGTREDIVEESDEYIQFAYMAGQGEYRLRLPRRCCYIIEPDSTVENIAMHVARCLKSEESSHHFRVQAFEGVGKGAIVSL